MLADNLDLWIDAGDRGYPLRAASRRQGEARGRLALDPDGEPLRQISARLEARETSEAYLREVGALLFDALFGSANPSLGALLYRWIGAEGRGDGGLRVRLRLEPPEIAALPWELLFDATRGRFLATSLLPSLVRYVELDRGISHLDTALPVRLLVVIPDAHDLDTDREKAILEEALGELRGRVEITYLEGCVSYERLSDRLLEHHHDALHFVGHGDFRGDQAGLRLNAPDGSEGWVGAADLADLFRNRPSVKLVVLNACKGGRVSSTKALVGMAPQLVQEGMPAVVAMQYAVYDDVAILFAREFYRSLFRGRSRGDLEFAIAHARSRMATDFRGERSFAAPVLYLRAEEGMLFQFEEGGPIRDAFEGRQAELRSHSLLETRRRNVASLEGAELDAEIAAVERLEHGIRAARVIRASAAVAAVVAFLLFGVGFLDLGLHVESQLEGASIWLGDALRPQRISEELAIVAIDRETVAALGEESFGPGWRVHHAELLDRLSGAGARVVVFDMTFALRPGASREANRRLAAAIRTARRRGTAVVIAVKQLEDGEPAIAPEIRDALEAPIEDGAPGAWGHPALGTNFRLAHGLVVEKKHDEEDQEKEELVVRRLVPSIGLLAYAAHAGVSFLGLDASGGNVVLGDPESTGRLHAVAFAWDERAAPWKSGMIEAGDRVYYQFVDPTRAELLREPGRRFGYEDVLAGELPGELRGKLVLVGLQEGSDFARVWRGVPERHWGVELHAQAIDTLLRGVVIRPLHFGLQFLLMLAFASLAACVRIRVSSRRRRRLWLVALLLAAVVLALSASAVHDALLNVPYLVLAVAVAHGVAGRFAGSLPGGAAAAASP